MMATGEMPATDGLLERIKLEAELLQGLLTQLRLQQQALVAGDQPGILASSQQAEELVKQLHSASQARQSAQEPFESLDQAMSLTTDLRSRTQFKVCLQALRQGSGELKLLQQRNSALIAQGLSLVDATLTSFVELQQNAQPHVYGAHGAEDQPYSSERSILDFNA